MNDSELREMEQALDYPGNQSYDPVTLEPRNRVTIDRLRMIERNIPELLEGGPSLLDIGSSKGFVSLWLHDRYKAIVGYEMGTHAHAISEATRVRHGLDHIYFVNSSFQNIEVSKFERSRRYYTVYCGSVHHHFVKDALLHRAPWWLPLKKLAALTDRYLILDGPLWFEGDTSLPKWEAAYKWGPSVRAAYTPEAHAEALSPQFRVVRGPVDNERGRQTMVFERIAPDVLSEEITEAAEQEVRRTGMPVEANRARTGGSVVRMGDVRYKFDRGTQSAGVLGILNALPEWFAPTVKLLTCNGVVVGDVAKWIEGEPLDCFDLRAHWLRLNDILACVGLVEIHFKQFDFILRGGQCTDVDIDMVNSRRNIAEARDYLKKWRLSAGRFFGGVLADYIASNLSDEWVFRKARVKLFGGVDGD